MNGSRNHHGARNLGAIMTIVFALTIGGLQHPANAALPPDQVNFQGVLRAPSGAPRTGSFNMRFRFFDAETGGNEILVDQHAAGGSGSVVVSGGLFTVALGGGVVIDGAGSFPNDPYTSLTKVFADFSSVWVQIEVDSGSVYEILVPRVPVRSSPYALNYDNQPRALSGGYKFVSFQIDGTGGPPNVIRDPDGVIAGTSRPSTGIYNITLIPGVFSEQPYCVCSSSLSPHICTYDLAASTATVLKFGSRSSNNTQENSQQTYLCFGK